ncbi:hypothetical protein CHUAL_013723 [Chamberlinius hualienensis]
MGIFDRFKRFFVYQSFDNGNNRGVAHSVRINEISELVSSGSGQRNWRGIGIALLVIAIVCSLIITTVVVLTPGYSEFIISGDRFTLDDVIGPNYTPPRYNATWISDSEFLYQDNDGNIRLYDAANGSQPLFISSKTFRELNVHNYYLSSDRKYMLLASNIQKVFRYSFLAQYWIYNISTGTTKPLTVDPTEHDKLQLAKWGPVDNSIVFVQQNNIYYKPSIESAEVKILTNTIPEDSVFNGVPDWVYEEEILSSNSALWFSKDGKLLCFASFNDSLVPTQPFEWYGDPNRPLIYPQPDMIKYPKPAFPNPTVRLIVVNLTSGNEDVILENVIEPPADIPADEHYFTAAEWASNTELTVIWMNRRQNLSIISVCTPPLWICKESFREDMKQLGWVDWYEPPVFSSDGQRYLVRATFEEGNAGLFRHIAIKNLYDKPIKALTMGKFEVTKISSFDDKEGVVYFIAAPESKPNERQLYQISVNEISQNASGYCLTCHLGPDCLFVEAHFSLNSKYYNLECQGPAPPKTYLIESQTSKILATLETSDALSQHLITKAMPHVRTLTVPLEGGYDAYVRLLLPPEFRDDEKKTYPLIVNVYGGPGSQKVNDRFDIDWGHYLAGNKSFIYGSIDARGSGYLGEKRKFEMYRRLGTVEVQDQISVVNYLKDTLHYIDKKKVALWGWSYGGYVTAKALATDSKNVIKCGISVAPVTNWMFYDSVYTERYMGLPLPTDNFVGYENADVLKLASNFKDKEFYLIHGTADDNVHFQQSLLLSSALAEANVVFRSQVYPDENHGLYHVQKHLYLSLTDFLDQCFEVETKEKRVERAADKLD